MILSEIRPSIAALALAHTLGRPVSSIYDHAGKAHHDISITVEGEAVDGMDRSRLAKFSGSFPDILDHARKSYIHLSRDGSRYTGYDHKSSTHFIIDIRGETAALYDHDTESWTQFSLS